MHTKAPLTLWIIFSLLLPSEEIFAATARRFSSYQYALLPVLAVGSLFLNASDPPEKTCWKGGILFDGRFRDLFRSDQRETRDTIANVGDVLLGIVASYPVVVDAMADSFISQKDGETAGQLTLFAAQGLLFTTFLRQLAKIWVGRERPFQEECAGDSLYDPGCNQPTSRTSFFSGHAATSFTGAGLICSAHETFSLAGGMVPCYAALGLATAVSVTRLVADRHYFSDVLFGAAVGLASGYFLPQWIYGSDSEERKMIIAPSVSSQGCRLSLYLPW